MRLSGLKYTENVKNLVFKSLCAHTILTMIMTVYDNFSFARRSYSEGIKWRTWKLFFGLLVLLLVVSNFLFCFTLEVETPVENDSPLPPLDTNQHMNKPLTIMALKNYEKFIAHK